MLLLLTGEAIVPWPYSAAWTLGVAFQGCLNATELGLSNLTNAFGKLWYHQQSLEPPLVHWVVSALDSETCQSIQLTKGFDHLT